MTFVQVQSVDIPLEPVAPELSVAGEPRQGAVDFADVAGADVGIWEMTPGTADDVEVDEIFVVIAGAATVTFLDTDETIELSPGSLCRLTAGQRTRWVVTETLRKVYVVSSE